MSDSEQQDSLPSAQPVAPPTQPGAIAAPVKRSTWPMVIGILAIVLGGGGFLLGVWGAINSFIFEKYMAAIPQQDASLTVMQDWKAWNVASSLLNSVLGALLLFGGISLVMKLARTRKIITAWALIKIVAVVFTTILGVKVQQDMFAAMRQGPNMPPMGNTFYAAMGVVGMAFGLLWGWAFPVFVLIWFRRKKIKSQVAGWT